MKIVIQRVSRASVTIGGDLFSSIGAGLMVLVGVVEGDTADDVDWLAQKMVNMRIFDDEAGVMNRSVVDVGGDVLAVSQFTLAASTKKGNRPSYIHAAGHELAVPLYERFCEQVQLLLGRSVARGQFGANMQVELVNDGPVTIIVDSKNKV
ncbi:MAG TPA: D-tyrosyl-tRNA(Tyr) deacylase [Candidatus Avimuribaculum pullicola]|nr:D-tyrosyl-tRNA(Tyr) deacylase [Candidatus Avimuribaculum pullicola]